MRATYAGKVSAPCSDRQAPTSYVSSPFPPTPEVIRQATEGVPRDAVLHAAGLFRRDLRVHPGVEEHPLEEAMLGERLLGKTAPSGSELYIVADDAHKTLARQVGKRLGDAWLGNAQKLRHVDVAA